jgi:hypothetical protein
VNNPPFQFGVPLLGSQPTITIQAQLTEDERSRLREIIRNVLREELAALHKPEPQDCYICEMCGYEKGMEEYDRPNSK